MTEGKERQKDRKIEKGRQKVEKGIMK